MKKSVEFEKKLKLWNFYLVEAFIILVGIFIIYKSPLYASLIKESFKSSFYRQRLIRKYTLFIIFLSVINFLFHIIRVFKISKNKNKYDWNNVLKEIDFIETIYYEKAKLYLTPNYIISYKEGLDIFNIQDIVSVQTKFYQSHGSIFLIDKNSQKHKIVFFLYYNFNKSVFDKIYQDLLSRILK